jgi:hypothetical protein
MQEKYQTEFYNPDYPKIGSLVRGKSPGSYLSEGPSDTEGWTGIVVDYSGAQPVVFWSEKFPAEVEYADQLEVIS